MNVRTEGCPEGQGRDVWFRILPLNLTFDDSVTTTTLPVCESVAVYTAISLLLSIAALGLFLALAIAAALTPKQTKTVRRHYIANLIFLGLIIVTMGYGLGAPGGNSIEGRYAPVVLFSAVMIFYFVAALMHYHEMQSLAGKLMIGDQPIGGANSSSFLVGLRTYLGNNTKLDKGLVVLTSVLLFMMAVDFWIMVPISPFPTHAWFSPQGSIYQKDFFVSLGIWILDGVSAAFVSTALLLLWKIRSYIQQHIRDWNRIYTPPVAVARAGKRTSNAQNVTMRKSPSSADDVQVKIEQDDRDNNNNNSTTGNSNKDEERQKWKVLLNSIRWKIDTLICQAFVGYLVGTALLICMSLESILGMRWWAVILIFLVTLTQSTFVLSLHFPRREFRKRFLLGRRVIRTTPSSGGANDDDSKNCAAPQPPLKSDSSPRKKSATHGEVGALKSFTKHDGTSDNDLMIVASGGGSMTTLGGEDA